MMRGGRTAVDAFTENEGVVESLRGAAISF